MDFINDKMAENTFLDSKDLVEAIRDRFAISIHPRSVDRALANQKKVLATPRASPDTTANSEIILQTYEKMRQLAVKSASGRSCRTLFGMTIFRDLGALSWAKSWTDPLLRSTEPSVSAPNISQNKPRKTDGRDELLNILTRMALGSIEGVLYECGNQ